jgi:hypothetical protein
MAHCFDIHKSDRPCPHAPPEKQKHVLCGIIFELKVCGMQGLDPGKFVRVQEWNFNFFFKMVRQLPYDKPVK